MPYHYNAFLNPNLKDLKPPIACVISFSVVQLVNPMGFGVSLFDCVLIGYIWCPDIKNNSFFNWILCTLSFNMQLNYVLVTLRTENFDGEKGE